MSLTQTGLVKYVHDVRDAEVEGHLIEFSYLKVLYLTYAEKKSHTASLGETNLGLASREDDSN